MKKGQLTGEQVFQAVGARKLEKEADVTVPQRYDR